MATDTKLIVNIAQWLVSALAIPALVWAWNLSTAVEIQQREIEVLQADVSKSEKHAIQLAEMNANIGHLKESINELKDILRD